MKLIEVEDYRTVAKYREESIDLVQNYIDYADYGPLSGVEFDVSGEEGNRTVVIWQELDDEDEADKYRVYQKYVPPKLWKEFMAVVRKHNSG